MTTDNTPKSVEATLLERRSIRRYEREPIPEADMQFIYEAIRNTPTSYNGQQFSVIDIDDQAIKEKLYEITNQKQIKTCNRFLVFCADYNKISLIAREKGIAMPQFFDTLDGYNVGAVDAALAMMSAVTAAESRGLGTCCVGYARTANPDAIATLLHLPPHVAVICGLAIGVPRELPDLKPKQSADLLILHNQYSSDGMVERLADYDREITHYNATREGTKSSNDWAAHIISYYDEAMNYTMLDAMAHRGFRIRK